MNIIYCCQHPGFILQAVIHKFKYHLNDHAFLIFIPEKRKDYPKPFFPKINDFEFCDIITPDDVARWLASDDYESLKFNSDEICGNVFSKLNINPKESLSYFLFDWIPLFSFYYYIHDIHYSMFWIKNNFNPFATLDAYVVSLNRSLNFIGIDSNLCDYLLITNLVKLPSSCNKKVVIFSVVDSIKSLNASILSQLENSYNLSELYKSRNQTVLLLNSIGYFYYFLKKYSLEKYYIITQNEDDIMLNFYTMIADYFISSNRTVLFKGHPAFSKYLNYIISKKFNFLPSYIPFELFYCNTEYLRSNNFFCPIYSNSIQGLRSDGYNCTILGEDSFSFYPLLHFLYSSISFFIQRYDSSDVLVHFYGVNERLLNIFSESCFFSHKVILKNLNCSNVDIASNIVVANIDKQFDVLLEKLNKDALVFSFYSLPSFNGECNEFCLSSFCGINTQIYKDQIYYLYQNKSFDDYSVFSWYLKLSDLNIFCYPCIVITLSQIYPLIYCFTKLSDYFQKINLHQIPTKLVTTIFSSFFNQSITTSEELSTNAGMLNISNYFLTKEKRCMNPTEEIFFMKPLLQQHYIKSAFAIINFDYHCWKSASILNNPKLVNMGMMIKSSIESDKFILKKSYTLFFCKDKVLYQKIKSTVSDLVLDLNYGTSIKFKVVDLYSL